jgi:hypothetical protein
MLRFQTLWDAWEGLWLSEWIAFLCRGTVITNYQFPVGFQMLKENALQSSGHNTLIKYL